jgi:predicted membrane protein
MKKSTLMKKSKSILSCDNIVGLILAALILFEVKVEKDIKDILNSPPGMILALLLLVLIFVFMNPIVGALFLIYLYECVKDNDLYPSKYVNTSFAKQSVMNQLNRSTQSTKHDKDKVEIGVIKQMAPIIKKSENPNAKFIPHLNDKIPFNMV